VLFDCADDSRITGIGEKTKRMPEAKAVSSAPEPTPSPRARAVSQLMMPVSRPPSASRAPGRRSGLRERKKLAVRQALGSAALRLTVERGPENVTVEDITAEADVSLRTFGNYFSSKYEAICAIGTEALAEAIAARTGTDLEQDMYPRILAGAVIAAAQVASGGGPPPTRPCRPTCSRPPAWWSSRTWPRCTTTT